METSDIILCFKGDITPEAIEGLLAKLKKEILEQGKFKVNVYKKLLTLTIEILENIYRYRDSINKIKSLTHLYIPRFTLYFHKDEFTITACNPVITEDYFPLQQKIDFINSLDKAHFEKFYRQIIDNGQFTKQGGASLGLYEIAKASSSKLEYSFEKINDEFVYFTLQTKVLIH